MTSLLARLTEHLEALPEDEAEVIAKAVLGDPLAGQIWAPTSGPQKMAFDSKADILLYGGQAGGGKSGLLIGYALMKAEYSLILRRQYSDTGSLVKDTLRLWGTRKGFSGQPPARLVLGEGRQIDFSGCLLPEDWERWQGQPHDFIGIDEASQFLEGQVRALLGWNRPVGGSKVHCRAILATNPPINIGEGDWLRQWFAPWLDPSHRLYPTDPGVLLWVVTDAQGKDLWVDGPEPVQIKGRPMKPRSRTFIPAKLEDNPFLDPIEYRAVLESFPEPQRSAISQGDWMLSHEDHIQQILPTNWVMAAQERWTREPPRAAPMCAIGVDIAQGGADRTILQCRYDYWFAEPIVVPGSETPMGSDIAALVVRTRRNKAAVILDMGGGYGGGAYEMLKMNLEGEGPERVVFGFNGAETAHTRTMDRQLGFYNRRAEAWWRFREALDPDQEGGSPVMLPPDPELRAELVSAQWKMTPRGIQAESKADIVKRLGHSPDKADAAIMAWAVGPSYLTHGKIWRNYSVADRGTPRVARGHERQRRGR